jgi:xanthine dehydrogenase accessory factor
MDVLVEPLAGSACYSDLLLNITTGASAVMVTIIDDNDVKVFDTHKFVFSGTGNGNPATGRPELDEAITGISRQALADGQVRVTEVEVEGRLPGERTTVGLLIEPAVPSPEVLILGCGHIAVPLAAIAKMMGFRVTVVDDRPSFANKNRFPDADKVICNDFKQALNTINIGPKTFVVIITRGHRHDQECLRQIIRKPAAYIGMIGSRRRIGMVFEQMLGDGFQKSEIERVYAPIGLNIGAQTPEEIALSIMAQIVKVYRED